MGGPETSGDEVRLLNLSTVKESLEITNRIPCCIAFGPTLDTFVVGVGGHSKWAYLQVT